MAVEEPAAGVAVGGAVVGGQRGDHHRPDAQQAVDRPRPLGDAAEADERDLGRVDHPVHRLDPLVAEVGHGDRGVGQLRAAQPPGTGPGDQVTQLGHQLAGIQVVGVVDGGGDQAAAAQRDRHPEVDGRCRAGTRPRVQKPLSSGTWRAASAVALSSSAAGTSRSDMARLRLRSRSQARAALRSTVLLR